jgi:hypothetical protein
MLVLALHLEELVDRSAVVRTNFDREELASVRVFDPIGLPCFAPRCILRPLIPPLGPDRMAYVLETF